MGTVRPYSRGTSVADALFTATQQRVLGLLFGSPDRSFFAREVISRTGAGAGATQRELKRLTEAGLLTVARVGNQTRYQANEASPVFRELRDLVVKTVGLVDPIRRALQPLRRKIDLALVYGSVARGEETASSDVDLLIVSDDLTLEEVFRKLAPAEKTLGRTINPALFGSDEFDRRRGEKGSFVEKVMGGKTLVLIGDDRAVEASR